MKQFLRCLAALALAGVACFSAPQPSRAAQGSGCIPTTGNYNGLQAVQYMNAAIAALISSNSGASAPATDCSGVAVTGQLWFDQSATPPHIRAYDSSTWVDIGAVDTSAHRWTPPIGGGTGTVASASTTDLCSVPQAVVTVTGTTGITSFGSTCLPGAVKLVKFAGVLTVSYNVTSLILPGGANLTTQAGGWAILTSSSAGNWVVLAWLNADGSPTALSSGAVTTALGYTPAHAGANGDITSLTGLTTPLPVAQGGTGATTTSGALSNLGAAAASAIPSAASAADIQAGSSTTKMVTPNALSVSAVPLGLTYGSTVTWNMAQGYNAAVILTGNISTLSITNPVIGQTYTILLFQDSSGSRTIAWPSSFDWGAAGAPTLSTSAGKIDLVTLFCLNASTPTFLASIAKGF